MTARFFDPLLRAELSELHAYEPHAGHFEVRLDANESPPLLSVEASAALAQAMIPAQYNRYPDARAVALREAIAASCGASPEEILVGTGTDEVIALLLTALDRPRDRAPAASIVTPSPTFVMYRLSARARGFKVVEVPLDGAWDLDAGGMVRAVELAQPNLIFVATPNNPTGTRVSLERLRAVIEASPEALVVVDEAYVDFAGAGAEEQLSLLRAYPNVALLRTLSKVGFAALRVGWLVAPAELVREIDKTRQPYNLPVPSQQGATFVLRNLGAEIARMRDVVVAERGRLAVALAGLGFNVTPSEANFLWVECARPAGEVVSELAARGVLVKSFHASGGRLLKRMRITVGLPGENDRLLHELAACR